MKNKTLATIILLYLSCIQTYGQLNFDAGSQFKSGVSYGTMTDSRDGKVYKTIKIGTQTWLAENLSYKTTTGSFAFDLDESIAKRYGRLYDWKTATTVCPQGWHLPSNAEWNLLTEFLEDSIAGTKVKATTGWIPSKLVGNNNSGFCGLGSGYRHEDGTFGSLGLNANFWSATAVDSELVWGRNLYYMSEKVNIRKYSRTNFYSIRCVKD